MDISKYRHDHDLLKDLFHSLLKLSYDPIDYVSDISSVISRITSKLKIHLITEEAVIYYRLSELKKENLQEIISESCNKIFTTRQDWENYHQKWRDDLQISRNPEDFTADTTKIIDVILDRIKLEEEILYPLAEEYI